MTFVRPFSTESRESAPKSFTCCVVWSQKRPVSFRPSLRPCSMKNRRTTEPSWQSFWPSTPHAADTAVSALIKALQDEEWMVRGVAAEALASFGAKAEPALPMLHELLKERKRGDHPDLTGKTETQVAHEKAKRSIQSIKDAIQRKISPK